MWLRKKNQFTIILIYIIYRRIGSDVLYWAVVAHSCRLNIETKKRNKQNKYICRYNTRVK